MASRIEIELTSQRDDTTWTWRAAGAKQPKGTVDASVLPADASVGDVLRAEADFDIDGITVLSTTTPERKRSEPETLTLLAPESDEPAVTTSLVRGSRDDRRKGPKGTRRSKRKDRPEREPSKRREHPEVPPPPSRPKPPRLKASRTHRKAVLDEIPAEQRPVAEQVLKGGIPAVRTALEKQNVELREAGKPEVKADALVTLAESLLPRLRTAEWRDRAEAALEQIDEVDLRDLRSVVTAADRAARDDETRALAAQLREGLNRRIEAEQAMWVADLTEAIENSRTIRALRLSSRPPKAGTPVPPELAERLVAMTNESLTADISADRWTRVLDALAYSPIRRLVVPASLPSKPHKDLLETLARLGTRLPEMAHIFGVEPETKPRRRKARSSAKQERRSKPKPRRKREADRPEPDTERPQAEQAEPDTERPQAQQAEPDTEEPRTEPPNAQQAEPATEEPRPEPPPATSEDQ